MPVTIAFALSLAAVAAILMPGRVDVVTPRATAPRAPGAIGQPRDGAQRAVDRRIERQVRKAMQDDPFLAVAAPRVKATSRRGVVRLVGRVPTAKERRSIAFKAGQTAGVGRVDDRMTVGNGVESAER